MSKRRESVNIYLAAPLFNDRERSWNADLADLIETYGSVFLPQRDGLLYRDLVSGGLSPDQARRLVYDVDISALRACDMIVAVLDGRCVDEGVAYELGFASALEKYCVGFKTDDRALLPTGDNPMILGACERICTSVEELELAIAGYCERAEMAASIFDLD